ncbi:MAG TPA: cellulase family glycosylhydrolase [Candidatus Acidoferrum sp.]|nr:cellulase family glycosylhydrolase [Candidatus Acidoferrum sp.]
MRRTLGGLIALLMIGAFAGVRVEARPLGGDREQKDSAQKPSVIVFWEDGFPAADTAQPSRGALNALFPGAAFTTADHLSDALSAEETKLLVMPFGAAFPEQAWTVIHGYFDRGGNLLVLGGRPFTRAAYKEQPKGPWKLRAPIQAFARSLFLNDYQETPGSDMAAFMANEDFSFLELPAFAWKRAWSATVRLTDEDLYKREGSAGSLDARLDTLVWGVANGRKLAAPVIEIDHLQNQFAGGRWILVECELGDGFYASTAAKNLVGKLAKRAADSAEDFTVQPSWPVFLPGEPLTFTLHWQRYGSKPTTIAITSGHNEIQGIMAHVVLAIEGDGDDPESNSFNPATDTSPISMQITMPPLKGRTLHSVTAKLYLGNEVREVWRTGFWIRDDEMLQSGPQLGKSGDYFTVDGKPELVAGTTYMASDVQREFLMRPNPWLWDRDMAQIHAAGINTLRTGMWSAWDQVMKQSGVMHEEMFRALEAYLLCARKNGLTVQFTFFAFTPEVLGGSNPYLDPEAIRRQKEFVGAFAERFHDVPFLAWDLINEPSFSNPQKTWQTRPNGDAHELIAWNAWLGKHYSDHGAIAEAWRSIPVAEGAQVPLPAEPEFSSRAAYESWPSSNSLRAMDYEHFAQDAFRDWAAAMAGAIHGAGSHQLITVGEDEGGGEERPSPAVFGDVMDFTTTHTWWASDALLWDSLMAKLPGKPTLVQETGISHELRLDGEAHRTPAEETALFERKLAMAAGTSAGAIEWLWNVNAYQRDDREATIGAIRPDGTEKPEAELMRRFAKFAAGAGPHMTRAALPDVAIVTSQALQFSPLQNLATEAQQKSVRALHYLCNVPGYVLTENQAARLAELKPKLAILPSPQALTDEAWKQLMNYVEEGGTLLVTGSVERDAHWRVTQRLAPLGAPEAILLRGATQRIGNQEVALNFGFDKQQSAEMMRFADGETLHAIAHGNGHILIASEPVELAEGLRATAELYAWALAQAGVQSPYDGKTSEAVLVRPVALADSVLYLIVSESANEEEIAVRDRTTGAEIKTKLAPGHAQLWLISKTGGQVLAKFAE